MPKKVQSLIKLIMPEEHEWKIKLLTEWKTIVGGLHAHVTIEKITNDTLFLGVFSASWLQELYLLSPLLCETINKNLDRAHIKQLRFKQVAPKKPVSLKSETKHKTIPQTSITDKETQHLEKVPDQELRQVLKLFLMRCKRESL